MRRAAIAASLLLSVAPVLTAQSVQVTNPANGHVYFLTDGYMTLPEARCLAETAGGYVVAVNDAAEQAFLDASFSGYFAAWIGCSDEVQEGVFLWDSGEPFTYSNWCPGEPNNFYLENYAELSEFCTPGTNRWNDVWSENLSKAIIELPGPFVPPAGPGQHNSLEASLRVNGIGCSGAGPFTAFVDAGSTVTFDWIGPPGALYVLFAGPLSATPYPVGCIGWVDIGTPPMFGDVIQVFSPALQSLFVLGSNGTARQTFTIPDPLPSGPLVTFQGVVIQPPAAACSLKLTAATTLEIN